MVDYPESTQLRKGRTPAALHVFTRSFTVFKVEFEYVCDWDTKIYANVYLWDEGSPYGCDFKHETIKLEATSEYKKMIFVVRSGEVIGEQRANIRMWAETKFPVRIRNCYVKVIKRGEYTNAPPEKNYEGLFEDFIEETDSKPENGDEEKSGKQKEEPKEEPTYRRTSSKKTNTEGITRKKKRRKRDKKILLIIDKNRKRSPLLTAWQNELCKCKKYIVVRDQRTELHLRDIVKKELGNRLPDVIYAGFDTGLFFINSRDYILENNISVVSETGDNDLFGKQRICTQRVSGIPIKLLICHSLYHIENVYNRRHDFSFLKDAEVAYFPWCIDPKKYHRDLKRTIDVTCISTATPGWPFHGNKIAVKDIVNQLNKLDGKSIIKWTENVYGSKYIDVLNKSKIFVVAGRGRLTLPQKYLEGAAAGCMLIGEIPPELDGIVKDGEGIVGVRMGKYGNLKSLIHYYLRHPEERKAIAENGKENIIKHFSVKKVAGDFIAKLEELKLL